MVVKVKLFGNLRDRTAERDVTGLVGIMTIDNEKAARVAEVMSLLRLTREEIGHLFLNFSYSTPEARLSDGDIISLFPKNMEIKWLQ